MAFPRRVDAKIVRLPWSIMREAGIVGMNERNGDYISRFNSRKLYPLVDDKLTTKRLAVEVGIQVPELYATVEFEHQIRDLHEHLAGRRSFVIKPAKGAGGDGIIVISGRQGMDYIKASGATIDRDALSHHISNTLSGMFSLGGLPDRAMVEYCVQFDSAFAQISYQGVPDIRVLVFRGVPIAAMLRLPTRASDGKANLHQGAVGAGIDLRSGVTTHGVMRGHTVRQHPDTLHAIEGFTVPHWPVILRLAARCHELAPLGYLGVDIVLDWELGPLVLELNARPGLAIQLANGRGLRPALQKIAAIAQIPMDADTRVDLSLSLCSPASPN